MSNSGRPVRIVMVDDDRDDLFLTEISFRQADFPVEFIGLEGANDLFKYIKDQGIGTIDVLLLDLNMPVTGGLETLDILKEYPHSDELNIFMFSTSTSNVDRELCLMSGAKGYLNKPSGLDQMKKFVEIINESLKESRMSMAS